VEELFKPWIIYRVTANGVLEWVYTFCGDSPVWTCERGQARRFAAREQAEEAAMLLAIEVPPLFGALSVERL